MIRKFMRRVPFRDFMDILAVVFGVGILFVISVLFGV